LAAFHAFWWDSPALPDLAPFPDEASVASAIAGYRDTFPHFADFFAERLTQPQRRLYDDVLDQLPRLLLRESRGKDLTLIHGDAHLGNMLLPRDAIGGRGLIIDWQLWASALAHTTLAHLIALNWQMDHERALERALLRRYHEQLLQHGVTPLRLARLLGRLSPAVILTGHLHAMCLGERCAGCRGQFQLSCTPWKRIRISAALSYCVPSDSGRQISTTGRLPACLPDRFSNTNQLADRCERGFFLAHITLARPRGSTRPSRRLPPRWSASE